MHLTLCKHQIRLLFNRKNKTLRSVLLTKSTIRLLEENMNTHEAMKRSDINKPGANNNVMTMADNEYGNKEDDDDEMEQDTGDKKEKSATYKKVEQIIEEIVAREEWAGKRASKLDLDDFLNLLSQFNERGVHFA